MAQELQSAGFYTPNTAAQAWRRQEAARLGIPYGEILFRMIPDARSDRYHGLLGWWRRRRDQGRLDKLYSEYTRRSAEEAEESGRIYEEGTKQIAVLSFNTG